MKDTSEDLYLEFREAAHDEKNLKRFVELLSKLDELSFFYQQALMSSLMHAEEDVLFLAEYLRYTPNMEILEYAQGFPLRKACERGDMALVELLLQKGVNPNLHHAEALANAYQGGFSKIVEVLLQHGASQSLAVQGTMRDPFEIVNLSRPPKFEN